MSAKGGHSRHRGREVALQTLYAIDVGRRPRPGTLPSEDAGANGAIASPAAAEATDPAAVFEGVALYFEAPPGVREFAWALVSAVCDRGPAIDELIASRAKNWRLSRMAAVDRNILRLGTYELAHTDTPPAVVMDEAVELARRFGSDASPSFVNGILDALARGLREVDA